MTPWNILGDAARKYILKNKKENIKSSAYFTYE